MASSNFRPRTSRPTGSACRGCKPGRGATTLGIRPGPLNVGTQTNVNGNGWVGAQLPSVVAVGSGVAVISNGTTARTFADNGNGTYTERFFGRNTLTRDGSGVFTLSTPAGVKFRFASLTDAVTGKRGQLLSRTDPFGGVITVTCDSAGRVTQVSRGGAAEGQTVAETWNYEYSTFGPSVGRLAQVTLKKGPAAAQTTVRYVFYTYYDGSEAYGTLGDLKTAQTCNASGVVLGMHYYRYYTSGEANGYAGGLKYYLSPASYDRLAGTVPNPLTATDTQLAPFADNYFQYDSGQRVSLEKVQGHGCSACTGGLGQYAFTFTTSSNPDGYNSWAVKTVETLPDGNQNVVYTNAYGGVMLKSFQSGGQQWNTFYQYDGQGRVVRMALPSAVTGYNDVYADLLASSGSNYTYLSDATGLVVNYDYYSSTTAPTRTSVAATAPGDAGAVAGNWKGVSLQQGEFGQQARQLDPTYFTVVNGGVTVHPLAARTVYSIASSSGGGGQTTTYGYGFFSSGTTQVQSMTITRPAAQTTQNGSGVADTDTAVLDRYSRVVWTKDADGFLRYFEYDPATGVATKAVRDANTGAGGFTTPVPSGWVTPAGGGLHLTTAMEVDALGRATKATSPAGNLSLIHI
jgi:YD repeat-containing protein